MPRGAFFLLGKTTVEAGGGTHNKGLAHPAQL